MQTEITTIFVICDDYLKGMKLRDDEQVEMTTAEVMTTALVSARFFKNCLEPARKFMKEEGYIPKMLSESRLNRRLHKIREGVWLGLFHALASVHKQFNDSLEYVVDSFPIAVCDNYRIKRCRLYRSNSKAYRGYIASKHRFFYGLRAHVLVTATGEPVDLVLAPGSVADLVGFKRLQLDLPDGATIYADKAYTEYVCEDVMNEDTAISLVVLRKKNSSRPMDGCLRYICHHVRKRVETSFSRVSDFFSKRIYAITARGVELKSFMAFLAFSLSAFCPTDW